MERLISILCVTYSWAFLTMFRVQQGPPTPPPINTRFAIINTIYNNPFHWSVFKGLVGFAVGVVIARTVSEEWANSV
ncbi:hypothetical protein RB195_002646 [Necator americanus]